MLLSTLIRTDVFLLDGSICQETLSGALLGSLVEAGMCVELARAVDYITKGCVVGTTGMVSSRSLTALTVTIGR